MILGIILIVVGMVLETSRFAIAFMKGKEVFAGDMYKIPYRVLEKAEEQYE